MDGRQKDGHGSRTVRSRKLDGTVTEDGRDGHGSRTGWSRLVVKNERFTVDSYKGWSNTNLTDSNYFLLDCLDLEIFLFQIDFTY